MRSDGVPDSRLQGCFGNNTDIQSRDIGRKNLPGGTTDEQGILDFGFDFDFCFDPLLQYGDHGYTPPRTLAVRRDPPGAYICRMLTGALQSDGVDSPLGLCCNCAVFGAVIVL